MSLVAEHVICDNCNQPKSEHSKRFLRCPSWTTRATSFVPQRESLDASVSAQMDKAAAFRMLDEIEDEDAYVAAHGELVRDGSGVRLPGDESELREGPGALARSAGLEDELAEHVEAMPDDRERPEGTPEADCETCNGTGYLCQNCHQPDGMCSCEEGPDLEPCPDCGGVNA